MLQIECDRWKNVTIEFGQDQSAETTTYNSPQNRRIGHISNLSGDLTVE